MAAAEPGSDAHSTATTAFEQALTVIDTSRHAQTAHPDLLHPAAAKVLATLDREWDGLARHRDPDLALDNNISEVRHEVARSEWMRRKEGRRMIVSAA